MTFYFQACCLFTIGVIVGDGNAAVASMFCMFQ